MSVCVSRSCFTAALVVGLTTTLCACGAEPVVRPMTTPAGVRFAVLGEPPAGPAPTLFVFAHTAEGTLTQEAYSKAGRLLLPQGWLCVSLDLPCHGQDARAGEAAELSGWRQRAESGEAFIDDFTTRCRAVLDYLVEQKRTDPQRVAACGTSRGGFMALQFTAVEPRVRCVAAFAPATELAALREFAGLEGDPRVTKLDVANLADKLSDRATWVAIGNFDERVGTDRAISLTRRIVAAAVENRRAPRVELHVVASKGHGLHPAAHPEASAWIAAQITP